MLDFVLKIISNVLQLKEGELNFDSDIKNTVNWDSLNHIKVLMALCDTFELDFNSLPITELTSVRKICNFLKEEKMIEKISSMAIVVAGSKTARKVLMLNSSGEWVFPKGHVEQGETYLETAIRELKEESGVVVTEQQSIGQVDEFSFYFSGENAMKVIKVFGFIIEAEQEINYNKNEHFIDGAWVDIDEAITKLKHDDARNALKKFLERL